MFKIMFDLPFVTSPVFAAAAAALACSCVPPTIHNHAVNSTLPKCRVTEGLHNGKFLCSPRPYPIAMLRCSDRPPSAKTKLPFVLLSGRAL